MASIRRSSRWSTSSNGWRAIDDRAIDYPVALDNHYEIWKAFDNHYWPAVYFVDRDGVIRGNHFGEGRYEPTERVIQRLLGVERDLVSVEGSGVEAAADWINLRSPETYLGLARRERMASLERLDLNQWALTSEWATAEERVVLEQAGRSIAYRFHARDAHLVFSRATAEPIPFRVLLDGEPAGRSHGVDVDERGNGLLRDGRLYQLIRQHDRVRERTLEINFLGQGAEAYVFTFRVSVVPALSWERPLPVRAHFHCSRATGGTGRVPVAVAGFWMIC